MTKAKDPSKRDETAAHAGGDGEIPLGQRLLDSPFLLLTAGLVVMFVFYTIWGMFEILGLPHATLP